MDHFSSTDVTFLTRDPDVFLNLILKFHIIKVNQKFQNIEKLSGVELVFSLQILFTSGIISAELVIFMVCDWRFSFKI